MALNSQNIVSIDRIAYLFFTFESIGNATCTQYYKLYESYPSGNLNGIPSALRVTMNYLILRYSLLLLIEHWNFLRKSSEILKIPTPVLYTYIYR